MPNWAFPSDATTIIEALQIVYKSTSFPDIYISGKKFTVLNIDNNIEHENCKNTTMKKWKMFTNLL